MVRMKTGRRILGRADGHGFRSVKLLLGPGANLFQFRVQSSDFRVEFDKIQAGTRDQAPSLSTAMSRALFQAYAGGRQISQWVPVQVNEVKTCRLHAGIVRRKSPVCNFLHTEFLIDWR